MAGFRFRQFGALSHAALVGVAIVLHRECSGLRTPCPNTVQPYGFTLKSSSFSPPRSAFSWARRLWRVRGSGGPPFVFCPFLPLFVLVSRSLGCLTFLDLMWVTMLAQDWSNNSWQIYQLFVLSLGPQQNLYDSCCAVPLKPIKLLGVSSK